MEYEDYQAFSDSMTSEEVTDRLNKYNKEYLDCHNDVLRLEKKNEQLKEELSEKDIELDYLQSENKHMRDLVNENKQLKFELKECKERKLFSRRQLEKENKQLKQRIRQLELSCECQAEFISNKGFDIRDVAEFARRK